MVLHEDTATLEHGPRGSSLPGRGRHPLVRGDPAGTALAGHRDSGWHGGTAGILVHQYATDHADWGDADRAALAAACARSARAGRPVKPTVPHGDYLTRVRVMILIAVVLYLALDRALAYWVS